LLLSKNSVFLKRSINNRAKPWLMVSLKVRQHLLHFISKGTKISFFKNCPKDLPDTTVVLLIAKGA
jgi:hypothetical protein